MKVVYTTAAQVDLVEIAAWIAQDSPSQAESFADRLRQTCEALEHMPRRFQLVPRHEASGIRRRPYGNYLIFYWVKDEDTVEILHVLHGARDYEKILFPESD